MPITPGNIKPLNRPGQRNVIALPVLKLIRLPGMITKQLIRSDRGRQLHINLEGLKIIEYPNQTAVFIPFCLAASGFMNMNGLPW